MDYTCFYFYLCKMFLELDFGSNYYQEKDFLAKIKIEARYYIVFFQLSELYFRILDLEIDI